MRISPRSAVSGDDVGDPPQRIRSRNVSVHEAEGLPVMGTHTDLESALSGDLIGHHATHFQSEDLSADDTVLDDDIDPAIQHEIDERDVALVHTRFIGQWFRRCHDQLVRCGPTLDRPHRDVRSEFAGATGQLASAVGNQNVEMSGFVSKSPRQRDSETSFGLFLDQDPGGRTMEQGCTHAETDCMTGTDCMAECVAGSVAGTTDSSEVVLDQRGQFGAEEACAPISVHRHRELLKSR